MIDVWQIRKIDKLLNVWAVLCRILLVVSTWQAVQVVKWSLQTASSVPGPTPLNWLQWDHKGTMTKKLWSASARTPCVSQRKTLLSTCSVQSGIYNSWIVSNIPTITNNMWKDKQRNVRKYCARSSMCSSRNLSSGTHQ